MITDLEENIMNITYPKLTKEELDIFKDNVQKEYENTLPKSRRNRFLLCITAILIFTIFLGCLLSSFEFFNILKENFIYIFYRIMLFITIYIPICMFIVGIISVILFKDEELKYILSEIKRIESSLELIKQIKTRENDIVICNNNLYYPGEIFLENSNKTIDFLDIDCEYTDENLTFTIDDDYTAIKENFEKAKKMKF